MRQSLPKKKPKLKDIKAAEAAARRAKKKEEKEREENEKKRMKKYEDQLFAKIKRDRNTYDQRKRRAIERMVATEVKAAIAKLEADYEVSTQEVQQDLTEHVNTTQETLLEMREVVTKLEARVDDVIGLKGTVDETNTLVKSHAEFIATQKKKKKGERKNKGCKEGGRNADGHRASLHRPTPSVPFNVSRGQDTGPTTTRDTTRPNANSLGHHTTVTPVSSYSTGRQWSHGFSFAVGTHPIPHGCRALECPLTCPETI